MWARERVLFEEIDALLHPQGPIWNMKMPVANLRSPQTLMRIGHRASIHCCWRHINQFKSERRILDSNCKDDRKSLLPDRCDTDRAERCLSDFFQLSAGRMDLFKSHQYHWTVEKRIQEKNQAHGNHCRGNRLLSNPGLYNVENGGALEVKSCRKSA